MQHFYVWAKKAGIVLFWIGIWQLCALSVHNRILLAGPAETLLAFTGLIGTPSFWQAVWFSFSRITSGFFLAFFAGIFTGSLAYAFPFTGDFLAPPVQLMKAVPVAAFVILALLWTGSANLSVLISFIVVYPAVHAGTKTGLAGTDQKLLEMARIFRVPLHRKIIRIYRAGVCPHLLGICQSAAGMAFKSGIAAEVIGVPTGSVGEAFYQAKLYLSTPELFAWTFTVLLLSAAFEKIFLAALKKAGGCGKTNANPIHNQTI